MKKFWVEWVGLGISYASLIGTWITHYHPLFLLGGLVGLTVCIIGFVLRQLKP